MKIEDPEKIKSIIAQMEIKPELKTQINELLSDEYKLPEESNCMGAALFLLGKLSRPYYVGPFDMWLQVKNAIPVDGDGESGDLVSIEDSGVIDHTAVLIGNYEGEKVVFQKNDNRSRTYSLQGLSDLKKHYQDMELGWLFGIKMYRLPTI